MAADELARTGDLKALLRSACVLIFGIWFHSCFFTGPSTMTMLRPSCSGLLDHAVFLQSSARRMSSTSAALRMDHLPAPEHDRDLDLLPVLQEAEHVALLGLVVVLTDLGPELDLFDHDLALVLARLLGLSSSS